MRSKTAKRIYDSTPESVRQEVREHANKMVMENIKENNEILYRFLFEFKGEVPNCIGGLKYHHSLDYLQPVIEKISSYLFTYPEAVQKVTCLTVMTKTEAVYEHCVEFVKRFNSGELDLAKPQDVANEMLSALEWFCDRVDRGEVKSKRTYERFKEIINKVKPK